MQLNLRQAIKLVAKLREDLNKEQEKISNKFTMPLIVNGENVVSRERLSEVEETYANIEKITVDIVSLRNEISQANYDSGIASKNIKLQELRKLSRNIQRQLENARYISGNEVISGVGVVEKGVIKEHYLIDFMKFKEDEMTEIQNSLDEANSSIVIEVDLITVNE